MRADGRLVVAGVEVEAARPVGVEPWKVEWQEVTDDGAGRAPFRLEGVTEACARAVAAALMRESAAVVAQAKRMSPGA